MRKPFFSFIAFLALASTATAQTCGTDSFIDDLSVEDRARLGQQAFHAQFLQHAQGGFVHVRDFVFREDVHGRERVTQLAVIHIPFGCGGGLGPPSPPAPAALRLHDQPRIALPCGS